MKRDFDPCCLQRKSRIPCPSLWPVKAASERLGVGERRIHDVGVGKPKHKFPNRNPRQKSGLAQQPLVSRALEFEEVCQLIGICGQSVEDSLFVVSRGDQSMSVVLEKTRNMRKHLPSTPTGVEKLSHSQHGGHPAFDHVGERRLSAKHWIRIWQVNPTISEFLSIENIQRLEDTREKGDSRQSILIQ